MLSAIYSFNTGILVSFVFTMNRLSYAACLVLLGCRDPIPSESVEGSKVVAFLSWGTSLMLGACFVYPAMHFRLIWHYHEKVIFICASIWLTFVFF